MMPWWLAYCVGLPLTILLVGWLLVISDAQKRCAERELREAKEVDKLITMLLMYDKGEGLPQDPTLRPTWMQILNQVKRVQSSGQEEVQPRD